MDAALLNCMTGVCCPAAEAQTEAHVKALMKHGICSELEEATRVARFYTKHFDFAEKGTLMPIVRSVQKLSKAT